MKVKAVNMMLRSKAYRRYSKPENWIISLEKKTVQWKEMRNRAGKLQSVERGRC